MTALAAERRAAAASALDALFAPRAIAVLGASNDPAKFGHRIVRNLREGGFAGAIYPVHRTAAEIAGTACVPTLAAIEDGIDLVLISVPAEQVATGIEAAAGVGARAAVVFSSGFAEQGGEGAALQRGMVARAARAGVRVVGPNCMGVRSAGARLDASPMFVRPLPPGPVAMISQSGAFCSAAALALGAAGVGMSKLASIGNMADIGPAELIRYLGADPATGVIAAFIEGPGEPADFLDAVSEVAASKPVVILKGGRSSFGQRAALSHTSALAGDGRVWVSLLREAGAQVVDGSEELFDVAAAFARSGDRLPKGRRVAIFTVAGGPAVVAADQCAAQGLALPRLDEALGSLRGQLPAFASLANPIDLPGSARRELFPLCLEAAARLDTVDAILAIGIGVDLAEYAEGLCAARAEKPVIGSLIGAPRTEARLAACGVPNFPSVERAVRALRHLAERGGMRAPGLAPAVRVAPVAPVRPVALPAGELTEAEAKDVLLAYGLPVTREALAADAEAAVRAAESISYPVAAKVSLRGVLHKSEGGGVVLGIADAAGMRRAANAILARFEGGAILVQEMLPPGVELILGAERTAESGPVVMVGFGGILAELLEDVVFLRAPTTHGAALRVLGRLGKHRLLDGFRGCRRSIAPRSLPCWSLSETLIANPAIAEIDLNPVIAGPRGPVIADALIRTRAPGRG